MMAYTKYTQGVAQLQCR